MFKHILIPTDGSELSSKAVQSGIALAKSVGAKVTGITVTVPSQVFSDASPANAAGEKYLGQIKDAATAAGVHCNVIHAEHEQPYQAIIDATKRNGCDLSRDGFTRSTRRFRIHARKRNRQAAQTLYCSGACLSLT